ncbi:Jas TPL-binding domain [Sesbania bispinosa]|nr:Jas TPL-binding domain [Sesbania bispinosa]
MEDEHGLELSLGLSCGGSSVKPKSKDGSSSDTRTEEFVRSGKMVDEFKNIFDDDPLVTVTRRTGSSKPEENFFSDLSKAKEEDTSLNFWVADSNKPVQIEEDKQLETRNKRKMTFDEMNHQKKHEADVYHADLHDKAKTPQISMAEDGSADENKDVADCEAENSASRPVSRHGDGSKQFISASVSSDASKDVQGVADSSATDFNAEKRFTGSSEKDFKHANLTCGASFSVQQGNMMNAPYQSPVKESNSIHTPSPQISGVMPAATGKHTGLQPLWGLVSRRQQLNLSLAGRVPPVTGKAIERSKGDGRQRVIEEGSSSQPKDMEGSSSTNLRAKEVLEQSRGEGSSIVFPIIKPGLAADVKFGGSGSCPNLPWVSTTGSGSNGRTISGVTYRYNTNQIKIVCACHGSHMTPEEFVRHANEDQAQAN